MELNEKELKVQSEWDVAPEKTIHWGTANIPYLMSLHIFEKRLAASSEEEFERLVLGVSTDQEVQEKMTTARRVAELLGYKEQFLKSKKE
jgi:hypothetical protein